MSGKLDTTWTLDFTSDNYKLGLLLADEDSLKERDKNSCTLCNCNSLTLFSIQSVKRGYEGYNWALRIICKYLPVQIRQIPADT